MQQDGGTSMIKQWSVISDTIGAKVTVKSDGNQTKMLGKISYYFDVIT